MDQLAVIMGYVTENGIFLERFLCILPKVGHKAEMLFNIVTAVLYNYGIDIKKQRAVIY